MMVILKPPPWSDIQIGQMAEPTRADELEVRRELEGDTPFLAALFDAEPVEDDE